MPPKEDFCHCKQFKAQLNLEIHDRAKVSTVQVVIIKTFTQFGTSWFLGPSACLIDWNLNHEKPAIVIYLPHCDIFLGYMSYVSDDRYDHVK